MVLFGTIFWEPCFSSIVFVFTLSEVAIQTALKFIFILSHFYLTISVIFAPYKGLAHSEIGYAFLCKLLSKFIYIYVLAFTDCFKVNFPAALFVRSKKMCLNMNSAAYFSLVQIQKS
jgi:hypothetical protein